MVLNGSLWYLLVLYGPLRYLMVPYGLLWSLMVPYIPLWHLMVPYGPIRSDFVHIVHMAWYDPKWSSMDQYYPYGPVWSLDEGVKPLNGGGPPYPPSYWTALLVQ